MSAIFCHRGHEQFPSSKKGIYENKVVVQSGHQPSYCGGPHSWSCSLEVFAGAITKMKMILPVI